MARIYTRTGDDGTTGLIGGKRVSKDSLRIEACGSVDEVNAVLGMVRSQPVPVRVDRILERIQNDLFSIGSNLAVPEGIRSDAWNIRPLMGDEILALEADIDEIEIRLGHLQEFILPGGTAPGAMLHFARTVTRRAERSCVALARSERVDPQIIRYMNRLSDLFYVLARYVNRQASCSESHPTLRGKERS